MDKSLAVRFGSPATAAAYALAYRLASALSTPTTSLVLSAQPRLFAADRAQRRRLSLTIVLAATACSIAACIAMAVLAPLLPFVFGAAYHQASHIALLLSLLPLAFGIRFVLGSLLVAEGHAGVRALLEALGSIVMIVTAAISIPRFGAQGMVVMIMAAEGTVVVAAAIALVSLRRSPIRPGDLDVSVLPE